MTDKKVAMLGMVAVLMAGWAVIQGRISQSYQPDQIVISPLIEGLDIEAVQAIRLTSEQGAKTVDLVRDGGRFVITQKDRYPADVKKVNDLISGCLDMRISSDQRITEDGANHGELGVTTETAACQVEFLGADQKPIVGMLISTADDEGNSYVRLATADVVYRADDAPTVPTSASEFLDTVLFQVDQNQVVRAAVSGPDGTSYTLRKPAGGEITLDDMPAGKQFKGSTYNSVFNALSYFRFEDVLSSVDASREFTWTYEAQTQDDVVYTLEISPGDINYARASAQYTGPEPSVQQQVESEEQLKEREARFLAKEKAEKFNQKHKGWVYQIPSYKVTELTHGLDDLIETPEAPAEAAEIPEATAPVDPNR